MGNMFADIVGFVATMLGGFAFRDELANATSFAWARVGSTWRKARLWYLHSVAAGAWWMLTLVTVLLAAANIGVYALASDSLVGDDAWWSDVQLLVASIVFPLLAMCWVWLLPANRIRTWSWINERTEELKQLAEKHHERQLANAPQAELDTLEQEMEDKAEEFHKEFRSRYGKPRGPMIAVLVTIFAPILMGMGFALSAAFLSTRNGLEWYQALPIAMIGFVCYALGEVMLRLFSGVLEVVLGDAGDAFNRIANAVLVRPGLLVLPFITDENYDKVMPKPIEVPFMRAAAAVKGSTFSIRTMCLVFIGWSMLLPSLSILGVVIFVSILAYIIVMFHEHRKLDPKSFVDGSSRLHAWFMISVTFFRIVQLVILGLWSQWWSGYMIWNPIAHWVNNLLDDGGWNWLTLGLVIFGGTMAAFFAAKTKDMKHGFMLNAFRALTAFFGLLALLPIVGFALQLGGSTLRLPDMPSGHALAQSVEVATVEESHAPDTIDRLTGHGTPEETETVVAPALVLPSVPTTTPLVITGSVPAIPPAHSGDARESDAMCDRIARATDLTDLFRASMRRRYHCDG